MKRNLLWRFLFVLFVVLWSVREMNPPTPRELLGITGALLWGAVLWALA